MTKEVQQKLIDDHFLFKEGDRFLQVGKWSQQIDSVLLWQVLDNPRFIKLVPTQFCLKLYIMGYMNIFLHFYTYCTSTDIG
jgi:hypothetical protein